jgi:hypothetical protein
MSNQQITPILFFDNVEDALAPLSAGTEYNVCVLDCSGNTISISPPHPTYTNEFGKAVVQLNAVALGGINGLNN